MAKVKVFDAFKGKDVEMQTRDAKILQAIKPQRYRTRDMIMERAEAVSAPAEPEGEELDSAGEAWDEKLHVSTKLKNADGTWRKRPGAAKAAHE